MVEHNREDPPKATADAYAPPPAEPRSKKLMMVVVGLVAVCLVVIFVALSLR